MRRVRVTPRPAWQGLVEARGLLHHTNDDGSPYWVEDACYVLEPRQADAIEQATETLMEMCIAAAEAVIRGRRYAELGIPSALVPLIEASWERDAPALYDRFDLAFDQHGALKLLELNGATPTALVEAAITQHDFRLAHFPAADQFNWLWEALVAKWTELRVGKHVRGPVYTVSAPQPEDAMTAALIADSALAAGLEVREVHPDHIDWDHGARVLRDLSRTGHPRIDTLFSLIPLEWLVEQHFRDGTNTAAAISEAALAHQLVWMDPAWNVVFANKGILAVLWELYPDHPLLVPAYLDGPRGMADYVTKPCQSREGANVSMVRAGRAVARSLGTWETRERRCVYQALIEVAQCAGHYPTLGCWHVPDQGACGLGIRESSQPIAGPNDRFAPHVVM
jgi:glutathionylspermidine synthase